MPVFFNPAANLTAGRVALGAGGGGLTDSAGLRASVSNPASRALYLEADGITEFRLTCASDTNYFRGNVSSYRSRGTMAAPSAVQSGDWIWSVNGWARNPNGTNAQCGEIRATVDGAPSGDNVPAALLFFTGGASERARIDNSGNLLLGLTVSQGNGRLQLATHTTAIGGIGFGSDASLFRSGSQALSVTAAPASSLALRNITISTDAPPTPWTGADGDIWIQREA